jgi:hypothetical protein
MPGSKLKKIIIKKKNTIKEKKDIIINSTIIHFFSVYMQVPMTVTNAEYLDYYLDVLDKYYDSKAKWNIFFSELKKNSLSSIKEEINRVCFNIINYIKSCEEYHKFISEKYEIPNIDVENEIYSVVNSGKSFVSIDVKNANYRVLKYYCPSLCENLEWNDFIKKFTSNEIIITSKYFREIVFGKLGFKQIGKMPIIFIDKVIKHVELKYSEYLEILRCYNDEVIFKILPHKYVSFMSLLDEFRTWIDELDNECYRVDVFKLKQLGSRSYFVKENQNNKVDFKAIPKKFIVQCIKYYENKPIMDIDRKFTDDMNMVATYDKSIFDL